MTPVAGPGITTLLKATPERHGGPRLLCSPVADATGMDRLAARAFDRLKRDIDAAPAKDAQALSIAAGVLSDNEAKAAGFAGGPWIQVRLGWTDNAFGAEIRAGGRRNFLHKFRQ